MSIQFHNPNELSNAITKAIQETGIAVVSQTFSSLSAIPANFSGRAFISGVYMDFTNGFINNRSIFRLSLGGTGVVSIDTIDLAGTIVTNVFTYSLPTDVGIKSFVAESTTGIRITYSTTATVTYLG
jgi:hypothetical protein